MKTRTMTTFPYWGKVGNRGYHYSSGTIMQGTMNTESVFDPGKQYSYAWGRANPTSWVKDASYPLGSASISSASPSAYPKFNPCRHRVDRVICKPLGVWYQRVGYPHWYFAHYTRYAPATAYAQKDVQHLNPFPSDARRRAWWNIQPRFEGEVSMLNFLFELRDFKDLAKFLVKPDYIRLGRDLKKLISAPTKLASSGWLSWHLALKPLIGDLVSIHAQAIQCVREAQTQFHDLGLEQQTTHYSESTYFSDESVESNRPMIRRGELVSEQFTACMRYFYEYKMRSTTDAFLHYWGLTMNAEVMWNAIPFSFVVDYFVKIGDSLRAMRRDPNLSLSVNEYCESMRTIVHTGYWYSPNSRDRIVVIDDALVTGHRTTVTGLERTLYTRRITQPLKGVYVPKVKWPSRKQATTMAALVRCML